MDKEIIFAHTSSVEVNKFFQDNKLSKEFYKIGYQVHVITEGKPYTDGCWYIYKL